VALLGDCNPVRYRHLLSIFFGDEMLDVFTHKERTRYHRHGFKWRVIAALSLFLLALAGYYQLIATLGIKFDEVL